MSWLRFQRKPNDPKKVQMQYDVKLDDEELSALIDETDTLVKSLEANMDKLSRHPAVTVPRIWLSERFKNDDVYITPRTRMRLEVPLSVSLPLRTY